MLAERHCKLTPKQHLIVNSIANFIVLICFIISFNITWFTYKVIFTQTSEFSLTEINMKNSSWKSFGDFKEMCNEKYLNKFADLEEDCNMLSRFQLAGTLVKYI